jgi:uncharacterized alkaline shock family protein YloU
LEGWEGTRVEDGGKGQELVNDGSGHVRIADEVVGTIAGLAAIDVDGYAGMSGGLVGGISEILGKRNFTKGVKVTVGEKEAVVELFVVVDYGKRIPDVANEVQENVKRAVETMTGLHVTEVNVHIQGVSFGKEKEGKEEEAKEHLAQRT